jgi:molybdopterin-binding protein
MKLSARNKIPATVVAVNEGEAIANVALEACGTRLVASITLEAVRDLGLVAGSEVTVIVKASDLIIAVGD